MKYILLFAGVLSIANTLPFETDEAANTNADVPVRNSVLEQIILDVLEDMREIMLNGSDDIPVLDPLKIDHLHLDLGFLGLEDSHLTLENTEARQASTFVIDSLSVTVTSLLLQRYALEVEVHIPTIEIDAGTYDLNLNALGVNVFGNGSAKLKITEPRVKARIDVGVSLLGGLSINIRDANVVLALESFESHIIGLLDNHEVVAGFIDDFLAVFIPEVMTVFQDDISQFINSILIGLTFDLSLIGGNILKPSTLEAIENFKSTML